MTAGFRGPDGCAGMTTTKGGPVLKRSGMRRGGWGFVLVLAATLGWGLGSVSPAAAETVAAAASLQPVMEKLLPQFEKDKNMKLEAVFDASGNLARQIEMGAPFDVFLSADEKWARYLEEKGKLEKVRAFAECPLVLWWAKKEAPRMELMIDKAYRVAIADPETAPFGKLAKKYLVSKGWFDPIQKQGRLILGGDVLKAGLAAKSGGADLALLPLSIAQKLGGTWTKVPVAPQTLFGGLVAGRSVLAGRAFFDYLRTERAEPCFREAGFELIR